MYLNPQYEYDYGPYGDLAPLQARSEYPDSAYMISPPIGWVDLVVKLDAEIAALVPDYTITQVKEKFAGLRYYIGRLGIPDDDPRVAMVRELIAEAEAESQRTCQICGQPGRYREGSMPMMTTCDEHTR